MLPSGIKALFKSQVPSQEIPFVLRNPDSRCLLLPSHKTLLQELGPFLPSDDEMAEVGYTRNIKENSCEIAFT